MGMTKSAQEILAEWADPETGGTMPREVRDAALSVLEEMGGAFLQAKRFHAWCAPESLGANIARMLSNLNAIADERAIAEARVKELEAALKRIDAIACEHGRGAIGEAQGVARAALKPKP